MLGAHNSRNPSRATSTRYIVKSSLLRPESICGRCKNSVEHMARHHSATESSRQLCTLTGQFTSWVMHRPCPSNREPAAEVECHMGQSRYCIKQRHPQALISAAAKSAKAALREHSPAQLNCVIIHPSQEQARCLVRVLSENHESRAGGMM